MIAQSTQRRSMPRPSQRHIREPASSLPPESKGRSPTLLNLDEPYRQQPFTIVIWGADRAKFGKPEENYANKRVCVTGTITEFRGTPEIVAKDPAQMNTK